MKLGRRDAKPITASQPNAETQAAPASTLLIRYQNRHDGFESSPQCCQWLSTTDAWAWLVLAQSLPPYNATRRGMKQLDIRVSEVWRFVKWLGQGRFGTVYLVRHCRTNEQRAVKFEPLSVEHSSLAIEADAYDKLRGPGVPELYGEGEQDQYRFIMMQLLGPSLHCLFGLCRRNFGLKTVLLLADQLLRRLEHMHSKGIIHRDLAPSNLLMGSGRNANTVYVIDFGLRADVPQEEAGFVGNLRFAPIKGHTGEAQTEWDDCESLGYILVYFLRAGLPWDGLVDAPELDRAAILEKKRHTSVEQLCQGVPEEFAWYMRYVQARETPKPDYGRMRRKFQKLFKDRGEKFDHVYEWTIRLWHASRTAALEPKKIQPRGRSSAGGARKQSTHTDKSARVTRGRSRTHARELHDVRTRQRQKKDENMHLW